MSISLGVHVGQQNMTMDEMRALWRKLDQQGVDWISAWDHFYEAPPKGATEPHFEALTTLGETPIQLLGQVLPNLVCGLDSCSHRITPRISMVGVYLTAVLLFCQPYFNVQF